MTIDCFEVQQTPSLLRACAQKSRTAPSLKKRLAPWLKFVIACVCLALGLRLLDDAPPLIMLVGFALLIRVPGYCYFGWCDFQALKEGHVS